MFSTIEEVKAQVYLSYGLERGACIWVADRCHKAVELSEKMEGSMVKATRMNDISIHTNSVFISHGFLQHVRAEWSEMGLPAITSTSSQRVIT